MSDTYMLYGSATAAPNGGVYAVPASSSTTDPARLPEGMPAAIPADQAYYWSFAWQRDIRESMEALRAGDYELFDDPNDPNDVVRWLLETED